MRNVELHLMDSNGDVDLGVRAGLIEATDTSEPECSNCNDDVGPVDGAFYPYVVALDDRNQWVVCEECASGVLEPTNEEFIDYLDSFVSDAND